LDLLEYEAMDAFENRKNEVKKFGNKISKEDKSYRRAAYLNDISSFDNELFQLSDAESRLIDPKQRLLLMTAYRAFEDAGVLEELSNTHTGVFIGNSNMLNYKYFDIVKTIRPDLVDISSTSAHFSFSLIFSTSTSACLFCFFIVSFFFFAIIKPFLIINIIS